MAGLNGSSFDGRAGSGFLGSGHAEARALMIVRRPTRYFLSIARPDLTLGSRTSQMPPTTSACIQLLCSNRADSPSRLPVCGWHAADLGEHLMILFVTTPAIGIQRSYKPIVPDSSRRIVAVALGGQDPPGSRQRLRNRGEQVTLETAPANTRN
jgi:hypothetical protein